VIARLAASAQPARQAPLAQLAEAALTAVAGLAGALVPAADMAGRPPAGRLPNRP